MELNRSRIVDQNFKEQVLKEDFPAPHSQTLPAQAGLDRATFLELFHSQLVSRPFDLLARQLRERQQGFYTIGSSFSAVMPRGYVLSSCQQIIDKILKLQAGRNSWKTYFY